MIKKDYEDYIEVCTNKGCKEVLEECIRKGYCTECSADIFYDYWKCRDDSY